jgi:hypothetical protein
MKKLLLLLIACFSLTLINTANAELPFTPSTDTGSGAHWYRLKNQTLTDRGLLNYLKAVDYGVDVCMDYLEDTDFFLFCFVGDETTGFQIYNKALLGDDAKLITTFSSWLNPIVPAKSSESQEWDENGYAWTFNQNSYLLVEKDGAPFYFRAPYDMPGVAATISPYGGDDAIWTFEDPSTPVAVDKSKLETLIEECNSKLTADKENEDLYPKFEAGMVAFEAAIAAAQAVVDNTEITQAEVGVAIEALQKAKTNYRVALLDLPFTSSEEDNRIWYTIQEYTSEKYLSYDAGKNEATVNSTATDDNELWAFEGDNVTGITIYNKEAGNEVILTGIGSGSNFVMSASWDGVWKIDYNGSYYGILNANGKYKDDYSFDAYVILQYGVNLLFYGFVNEGCWIFAPENKTGFEPAFTSDLQVFARNGNVYVKGAKGTASIVSLTGTTTVFDAAKPYNVGQKGLYIVRVDGKNFKVIVY